MNERYFIDSYGGGFIIADYGADNEFGAAYAGVSLNWRMQPVVTDPFPTKEAAEEAISKLPAPKKSVRAIMEIKE